jgi:peptidoglycan/LPS O-acetylase OafA/YrhL
VPAAGPTPLFDFLAVVAGGPLLVALLVRSPEAAPRGFLWLGAISYPLYASHRALISVALETHLLGNGPGPLRGAMVAAAMLAVATSVHWLVERNPFVAKAALMHPAPQS